MSVKEGAMNQQRFLYFGTDINEDSAKELLETYNRLEEGETLCVYLGTDGGSVYDETVMVNAINDNAHRTKLVAFGGIFSSGFDMFFSAKCERKVLDGCRGLAHLTRFSGVVVPPHGLISKEQRNLARQIEDDTLRSLKLYRQIGMAKKQIKKIKKGKDVYFSTDDLRRFLATQTTKE